MRTPIIISMLCLGAWGAFAQDDEAAQRQQIHERALQIYCETNGNMGPRTEMHYKTAYSNVHAAYPEAPRDAKPAVPSTYYTALQYPPCYTYRNADGTEMMTCPGASFTPPHCNTPEAALNQIQDNGNTVESQGTFTGNYPDLHTLYPEAPANAKPAWPSGPYTELQNPPCYEYINKRGLKVTECPGAQFAPEHVYR